MPGHGTTSTRRATGRRALRSRPAAPAHDGRRARAARERGARRPRRGVRDRVPAGHGRCPCAAPAHRRRGRSCTAGAAPRWAAPPASSRRSAARAEEVEAALIRDEETLHEVRATVVGLSLAVHLLQEARRRPAPGTRIRLETLHASELERLERLLTEGPREEPRSVALAEVIDPFVDSVRTRGQRVLWGGTRCGPGAGATRSPRSSTSARERGPSRAGRRRRGRGLVRDGPRRAPGRRPRAGHRLRAGRDALRPRHAEPALARRGHRAATSPSG